MSQFYPYGLQKVPIPALWLNAKSFDLSTSNHLC
ncbi:hypothetical protein D910_02241 [Dendroctonus ponderosae]|uniref:Uncharacterized protein n=1 Tax=Dendroctonus ponderosae TaxID=77166 RepID=U4TVJ4_DENPD|nr:hypothetical protein D910_02241 [Dendroctonus ponderosae]